MKFLRSALILFIALTVLPLSAYADDNKNGDNKDGKDDIKFELVILHAAVDATRSTVTIDGLNFGETSKVSLGGTSLRVRSVRETQIVAELPASLAPGSYSLTVVRNSRLLFLLKNYDSFVLTIGAAGAQGPQGPAGPAGPTGPAGPWRRRFER
jgi:hypothetical protein